MTDPIVQALQRRVSELTPEISTVEHQIEERENRLRQVRDHRASLIIERETLLEEIERRKGYRSA